TKGSADRNETRAPMSKVNPGSRVVVSKPPEVTAQSPATPAAKTDAARVSTFDGVAADVKAHARLTLTHEQIEALAKVTTPGPVTSVPGIPAPPQVPGRLIVVNKGAPSANGEHFGPANDS